MEIVLIGKATKDLEDWKKSGNIVVLKRIRRMISEIQNTPFKGIGKPEALKYNLTGKWSRRITDKDRMVYEIENLELKIYSLKGHYDKDK